MGSVEGYLDESEGRISINDRVLSLYLQWIYFNVDETNVKYSDRSLNVVVLDCSSV